MTLHTLNVYRKVLPFTWVVCAHFIKLVWLKDVLKVDVHTVIAIACALYVRHESVWRKFHRTKLMESM